MRYHNEIVRDLSWHPYQPMMVSACFDGSLCQWEHCSPDAEAWAMPKPCSDRLEEEY